MRSNNQIVGQEGEQQACLHLQALGHSIVARNWRAGHLEIDIISLSPGQLHIVEVKSIFGSALADPLMKVNRKKRDNLVKAAKAFLNSPDRKELPTDLDVVFDVVCVNFKGTDITVDYHPGAYIPIYV